MQRISTPPSVQLGSDVGQLVTIDIAGAGKLTLIYMADPEGNIIELQKWH